MPKTTLVTLEKELGERGFNKYRTLAPAGDTQLTIWRRNDEEIITLYSSSGIYDIYYRLNDISELSVINPNAQG